jgi:CheY-like chemotaxis protein
MNRKSILIGEDSSVIQNLVKRVFELKNYRTLSAKNGQQVLDILQKEEVDLILLDLNMPILDGIDCLKKIRQLPTPKGQVPVIAITGNAPNYSEEEFKALGFQDVVLKPINFDTLFQKVESLLNQK